MRTLLAAALLAALLSAPAGAQTDDPSPAPSPAASPAPRPSPGVWRLSVLGGLAHASTSFTETRPFTEFAEEGRIESRYEQDPGPGFEIGAAWRFRPRRGVATAVSFARRKEAGSFSASIPHPLYFGAFRQATGDFEGRRQKETAVHLDLTFAGETGRLQWSLFAGPSVIGIDTDLVRSVEYTQAYPYDTVTVIGTPFETASGHAFGFNVGGALAWPAARHVAVASQVRFSRAQVALEPAPDDRVTVSAGGLSLAVGLRFDF